MTNVKEVNKHGLKNKSNNRLIEKRQKAIYKKIYIFSICTFSQKSFTLIFWR